MVPKLSVREFCVFYISLNVHIAKGTALRSFEPIADPYLEPHPFKKRIDVKIDSTMGDEVAGLFRLSVRDGEGEQSPIIDVAGRTQSVVGIRRSLGLNPPKLAR
ncbi:MAG TPA: hypothetical protein ENJ18_06265 [Nannocystis exedens]|nr:hypothetical protein [Nannocystis exedens]